MWLGVQQQLDKIVEGPDMNISANVKNRRKKSNYTINLKLDIPAQYQKLLPHQPITGEFLISTTLPTTHSNLKVNSARATLQHDGRGSGLDPSLLRGRHGKGLGAKVAGKNNISTAASKNVSKSHSRSPSHPAYTYERRQGQGNSAQPTSRLASRIIDQFDDDILGYTTPSTQLPEPRSARLPLRHQPLPPKPRSPAMTPQLDPYDQKQADELQLIRDIRHVQQSAQNRIQQLSLQYIRQKILCQASARRIQRAWRRYKTRKIIHVYSSISMKIGKQALQAGELSINKKVLTVKSCGFKSGMNEMKKNAKNSRQIVCEEYDLPISAQLLREKPKPRPQQKQVQLEQIQKWQQLIKQMRKKRQITNSLQARHYDPPLQPSVHQSAEKVEKNGIEDDNSAESNQFMYNYNKYLSRQVRKIEQVSDLGTNSQQQLQDKSCRQSITLNADQVDPHPQKNIVNSGKTSSHNDSHGQDKEQQVQSLINQLLQCLACELVIQINMKFQLRPQITGFFGQRQQPRGAKPEGICTNMDSIKDYLQNLISFILEQRPKVFAQGFSVPSNPEPTLLLQLLRNPQYFSVNQILRVVDQKPIVPVRLYEGHWEYASQLIYFENKHRDKQEENSRVARLKQITMTFFRAIFDCFNECLERYRVWGMQGRPYPWDKLVKPFPPIDCLDLVKNVIKAAYRNLSAMAVIFCGLHCEDKRPGLPQQVVEDIRQERMSVFLENQMASQQWLWHTWQLERPLILYRLGASIEDWLLGEACQEIGKIQAGVYFT